MKVFTLENTFGHNPGRAGLSFSLADRMAIVREFDQLGVDYVEMGCPGASASVRKFFGYARTEWHPAHARLVAAARLDAVREPVERDEEFQAVLDAGAPMVALAASCWHAEPALFENYCRRIGEAVRFLKTHALDVIFRNEDFFQCYCREPHFAMETLAAAKAAGADILCLSDSSGNGVPQLVREIAAEVRKRFPGILSISAHDDSDLALANTLEAVEQGFTQVEGSLNAYGTRRGLSNLCSIITNLHRLGRETVSEGKLREMTRVARLVAERGPAAFTAGEPLLDRIDRRVTERLTESSRRMLLDRIEHLESDGFDLRSADGTLEVLAYEALDPERRPFVAEHYELTSHGAPYTGAVSTATATLRVGGVVRSETENGDGAVNALERCLRQCLFAIYPEIAGLHVTDYRVELLDRAQGTTGRVRVSIEWWESGLRWLTAGISGDLIEASWNALVDGFRLTLLRHAGLPANADSSWAV